MFKSPCLKNGKDCEKRVVGCQCVCEEFKAAKEKYAKEYEVILRERKANLVYADYFCASRANRQRGNKYVTKPIGRR